MIKIDEGICWPKSAAKLFSCNYFTGMLDEHAQDLERLFLQLQLDSTLTQLASRDVDLE